MAMRFFLIAASAAVLASAQAPPSNSSECTAKSFSLPSWLIEDVKYDDGAVSFDVSNRAIDFAESLVCKTKETGLSACSIQGKRWANNTLEASVETNSESTTFYLKQSWTCNDRGKTLIFTAAGNSSAAIDYDAPVLIKGSLTSPVTITPAYPAGPRGHDSPGCTSKSETPSWTLSAVYFTDKPGDGNNSLPFQNFNLLVTNPANGYQASCMPRGSVGGQPDLSSLSCAGYEFQGTVGQYSIVTAAGFDPDTYAFTLNQTWYCDDTDAARPLQITASGTTTLPLTCTTSPGPNNRTSRYCTIERSSLPLDGNLATVTTLRPYALEEPIPPTRDGCTLTSIFNPRWEFSHFQTTTSGDETEDDSTSGTVSFEVILAAEDRGFQYPIPIYQGEALEGEEEGWYECDIGADGGNGLPLWPYKCSFRYDAEGQGLELKADWACRDLDRENPINFSGVTTTSVDTTLTCETTASGQSRCTTDDPGYIWVAPITDVTW
ncbi:hypothetical protein C7999DRAFT_39887 [Corynascus novoguineensis]|uniref:Ig-like domain-containing protein n=1 Tax=Corynascus novoguineensis TaxID=1126955 RepID=A0AAN7CV49_9PEZI|nr:hypothetical protein C7999DRAFT_39887 [Corynascus novoguineensis]